mgnify:CR=1 FL=1
MNKGRLLSYNDIIESVYKYACNQFGGDFGYCADKGKDLLARNIADAILKEVFGK